jgi:hypothetical protein
MVSYTIPRLRDILFLAIFTAAILLGPRMLNMDGDLPRHLAIGKYVLQGNPPPTADIFSHTREGIPFAPHKWLSGVLFYLVYLLNAEKGIVIISAIALAVTFLLIYTDRSKQAASNLTVLFITAWGAAVTSLHWIARPHLFTMLLLAIWIILTDRLARGEKLRWWVFAGLMLVWNNIHGEYISGLLITLSYLAGWVWDYLSNREKTLPGTGKQLGLVLGASLIVTILNPISLRAWTTVTTWLGNDYLMEKTQETVPPNFLNSEFYILLALIGFSIFILAAKRESISTGQSFMFAGFTVMVLTSARNVHIYGIIAPFVLAVPLAEIASFPFLKKIEEKIHTTEKSLRGILYPIAITVTAIIALNFSSLGQAQQFSPSYFPINAVEWLKSNPQQGRMFNPFDWGGYISFTIWPENKVFIDSQGDVYGESFIREYEQVTNLNGNWQGILDKYHVDWAIIPINWPLNGALQTEGWQQVYIDETTIILIH